MLDSGRAKIYHPSAGGKEVLLWFCFPHDLFGLAEINHGGSRQATAELCERSVVLSVERDDFHRFVQQRPAVSLLVIDLLSQRLRSLGNAMQELVASDVTARLVMLLTRLTTCYGKPSGDAICVDLNITQQELADMIGATRQTVSSILSALRRSGLLYFKNRRIYIVDPHALSEYAVSHAEA
jgi:CRP/FNR family transcriptional regulator